jgi:F-type H+-transporting ATPase subunit delta
MQNVSVARRYARALLEVTTESGTSDKVLPAVEALARALDASPELMEIFVNPAYGRALRKTVTEQLLAGLGQSDAGLVNLIRLLADRDRLPHLPAIARLYRDMVDERAGRVRGQVTSAVPLGKDALARLEKTLEKVTQRSVVLEAKVDPDVLGGLSTHVGSQVFDGTLRSQLEDLRRLLKGG